MPKLKLVVPNKMTLVLDRDVTKTLSQLTAARLARPYFITDYALVVPEVSEDSKEISKDILDLAKMSGLGEIFFDVNEALEKYPLFHTFDISEDKEAIEYGKVEKVKKENEARMMGADMKTMSVPLVPLNYIQTACCDLFDNLSGYLLEKDEIHFLMTRRIETVKPVLRIQKEHKENARKVLYDHYLKVYGKGFNRHEPFLILDLPKTKDSLKMEDTLYREAIHTFHLEDLGDLDLPTKIGLLSLEQCIGIIGNSYLVSVAWGLDKEFALGVGRSVNWTLPSSIKISEWQAPVSELMEVVGGKPIILSNILATMNRIGLLKWKN